MLLFFGRTFTVGGTSFTYGVVLMFLFYAVTWSRTRASRRRTSTRSPRSSSAARASSAARGTIVGTLIGAIIAGVFRIGLTLFGVAVVYQYLVTGIARVATWGSRFVIMDEPTAALGVKETAQVLDLIRRVRDRGLPVILISHDLPHVFELADRVHVMRLGRRVAVVTPKSHTMSRAVAIMTGAMTENGS